MPSLHAEGWRQGSLVAVQLTATSVDVVAGEYTVVEATNDLWVVASQDCDLDSASTTDSVATIELRPVREEAASVGWGIRSRVLRLGADLRVEADDPRLMISPRALAGLVEARRPALADSRARALKTWLGRRYGTHPRYLQSWCPLRGPSRKQ